MLLAPRRSREPGAPGASYGDGVQEYKNSMSLTAVAPEPGAGPFEARSRYTMVRRSREGAVVRRSREDRDHRRSGSSRGVVGTVRTAEVVRSCRVADAAEIGKIPGTLR